jgi:hypothetical protein
VVAMMMSRASCSLIPQGVGQRVLVRAGQGELHRGPDGL